MYFKNYQRIQPVPFVIIADFEALTKKIDTCHQNNDKSYTDPYQEHQPCGFGYKVICDQDPSYSKPFQYYRGGPSSSEDVIKNFIKNINKEAELCKETVKKHFNKQLIMTPENELDFINSTICHICEKEYSDRDNFIMKSK